MRLSMIVGSALLVALPLACEDNQPTAKREPREPATAREATPPARIPDVTPPPAAKKDEPATPPGGVEAPKALPKEDEEATGKIGVGAHLPKNCKTVMRADMKQIDKLPGARDQLIPALEQGQKAGTKLADIRKLLADASLDADKNLEELAVCTLSAMPSKPEMAPMEPGKEKPKAEPPKQPGEEKPGAPPPKMEEPPLKERPKGDQPPKMQEPLKEKPKAPEPLKEKPKAEKPKAQTPEAGKQADDATTDIVVAVSLGVPTANVVPALVEKRQLDQLQINGVAVAHDTKEGLFIGQSEDGTVLVTTSEASFREALDSGDRGTCNLDESKILNVCLSKTAMQELLFQGKAQPGPLYELLSSVERNTVALDADRRVVWTIRMPNPTRAAEMGGALKAFVQGMRDRPSQTGGLPRALADAKIAYQGNDVILGVEAKSEGEIFDVMRDLASGMRQPKKTL